MIDHYEAFLLLGRLRFFSVLWLQYFALFAFICMEGVGITGFVVGKQKVFSTFVKILILPAIGMVPWLIIYCFYRGNLPERAFTESRTRGLTLMALFDTNSYFYLGYAASAICLVYLFCIFRKRIRKKIFEDEESSFVMLSSVSIILICVIFLGPQQAFGIPLPATLLPTLVPWFRHGVYSAHLIQILLVVILMLLTKHIFSSQTLKIFFLAILLFMVGADGFRQDMSGGDRLLTRVASEKAIEVLASKPIRPVAHFPWELSSEFANNSDAIPCLMQAVHKMPLVNTCDYDEPATPLISAVQISDTCGKLNILRDAGVGFLIVYFSSGQPLLSACLLTAMSDGKISQISESGDVKVWGFLSD